MGFLRNVTTAAALVATVAGVSQAQIGVTGSTTGCFDSTTCTATTNSSNGAGVSFAGENFNWTALTTPQTVTLGTITFGGTSCAGYVGLCAFVPATGIFNLDASFSAPPTTPGSGAFNAFINGGFVATSGGANVNFDNATQSFAFDGGTLFLNANDLTVNLARGDAGTYNITGTVYYQASSTPEPSSMALLGTGLIGLVPMVRRRRK